MKFNIRRQGHAIKISDELFEILPEKIEILDGKLFWSDEERLNTLSALLENIGID